MISLLSSCISSENPKRIFFSQLVQLHEFWFQCTQHILPNFVSTSTCSALPCCPRYPSRIAYFSHSLHLSDKEPKLSTQLRLRLTTCFKLVIFQYSAWLSIIWVFICKFKNKYFSHFFKSSTLWVTYIMTYVFIPGCHDYPSLVFICKIQNGFFFKISSTSWVLISVHQTSSPTLREHIRMLRPFVFAKISSTNCLFLTFIALI